MTEEQLIVLGIIAAAFVAGWIVGVLTGRGRHAPKEESSAPADLERLEPEIRRSRLELERAVREYVAALANSVGAGAPGRPPAADLAGEVSAALQDDAANDSMLSVVGHNGGGALTEREMDLTDWGFAYGVAWARARERGADAPDEVVAREALRAAEAVFRDYTADAATPPAPAEPAGSSAG